VAQLSTLGSKTHHYEKERKANLVSGQKIWLGMGSALCVAGMACHWMFRGIACHISFCVASRQALRPVFCTGSSLAGCFDNYLLHKRRETTLALGKGLAIAYGFAA
jgi:hypothetical protein